MTNSTQTTTPIRRRAVDRAVEVLECFDRERSEWGVRELAQALGASPSSLHSTLTGLARAHLVRRTEDGRYRLGHRSAALGRRLLDGYDPAAAAGPVLAALAHRTGETIHLAALEGGEVVYLAKVEGRYAVRLASTVGQRFPSHATAAGKVLLAKDPDALERVLEGEFVAMTPRTITDRAALRAVVDEAREAGIAHDREEMETGAACLAIALPRPEGGHLAISLSGPAQRIHEQEQALIDHLRRAAAEYEHALTHSPRMKEELECSPT